MSTLYSLNSCSFYFQPSYPNTAATCDDAIRGSSNEGISLANVGTTFRHTWTTALCSMYLGVELPGLRLKEISFLAQQQECWSVGSRNKRYWVFEMAGLSTFPAQTFFILLAVIRPAPNLNHNSLLYCFLVDTSLFFFTSSTVPAGS